MASTSSASEKLRRFKRELVADLFLRRGVFWQDIRATRGALGITPAVQIPGPVDTNAHYPREWDRAEEIEQQRLRGKWLDLLFTLRERRIPEIYRLSGSSANWVRFLSACLLYDPPETGLLAFASYADPGSVRTGVERTSGAEFLPIERLPDPLKTKEDALWFRDAIIDEIGRRFLEPQGLDIRKMYGAVVGSRRREEGESQPLGHEYLDRESANEPRPYIVVTEETTEDDVRRAFRAIKRAEGHGRRGGRPGRDRLVAIQCAVLYEHHNAMDPADRRKKTWSFRRLAEHFSLESIQAAEDYVELGKRELAKKDTR